MIEFLCSTGCTRFSHFMCANWGDNFQTFSLCVSVCNFHSSGEGKVKGIKTSLLSLLITYSTKITYITQNKVSLGKRRVETTGEGMVMSHRMMEASLPPVETTPVVPSAWRKNLVFVTCAPWPP